MARGMAGTRRGNTPCVGCGHARVVHLDHGRGPCSRENYHQGPGVPAGAYGIRRCTCQRFTTTTRKA